jgi:hypothetical protein
MAAMFSGATVYIDNSLLTKISQVTAPRLVREVKSMFAYPKLTGVAIPNATDCVLSHDTVVLAQFLVGGVIAESSSGKVLTTASGIYLQTVPVAFQVKCSISTPAGFMEMSTSGNMSFSGGGITLQSLATLVKSGNTTSISSFSPVAAALPSLAGMYGYDADAKFPFDGYVSSFFSEVLAREVAQYFVMQLTQGVTVVCGAAMGSFLGLFMNPCAFGSTNRSIVVNLEPICAPLQDVPLPMDDLRLMAPASGISSTSGSCSTTQCWPYEILSNNWTATYSQCVFCLSSDGKTVGQSGTVSFFLPSGLAARRH